MCCAKYVHSHTNISWHQQFLRCFVDVLLAIDMNMENFLRPYISSFFSCSLLLTFIHLSTASINVCACVCVLHFVGFSRHSLSLIKIADSHVSIQQLGGFVCIRFMQTTHNAKKKNQRVREGGNVTYKRKQLDVRKYHKSVT